MKEKKGRYPSKPEGFIAWLTSTYDDAVARGLTGIAANLVQTYAMWLKVKKSMLEAAIVLYRNKKAVADFLTEEAVVSLGTSMDW